LGTSFQIAVYLPPGDVYVLELQTGTLEPLYSVQLSGNCQSLPVAMQAAPSGEVTLGIYALQLFPQHQGLLRKRPSCLGGFGDVARLSANGSLLFSSYMDMCGSAPTVAAGVEGLIFAGVQAAQAFTHSAVLALPVPVRPFNIQ
jgi:hypothetical protein